MIHRPKAWRSLLLGVLLGVALLGGCDNNSSGTSSNGASSTPSVGQSIPHIGILLYREDDTYVSLVREHLENLLGTEATLWVEAADSNQFRQNEQIQKMLDNNITALIVNLVSPQNASQVVDQAKKAGVPVVFFNREPDLRMLRTYEKACFVGTVPQAAGMMQGELIKRIMDAHPEFDRDGDGIISYVMLLGDPDNPEALARTEYSIREARNLGVNMRQIGETHVCHWDATLARQAMVLAWSQYGDAIELIVANNDSMALGAIDVLMAHGFNLGRDKDGDFIPVVGVDATPQAVAAINEGRMSATVRQDGEAMAQAIARLILNAVQGKNFLDGTDYIWDESGIAIRIPYEPYTVEQ